MRFAMRRAATPLHRPPAAETIPVAAVITAAVSEESSELLPLPSPLPPALAVALVLGPSGALEVGLGEFGPARRSCRAWS